MNSVLALNLLCETGRMPARLVDVPLLARLLLNGAAGKPQGFGKIRHKLAKLFYVAGYRWLGLAADGEITVQLPHGVRSFTADFSNTAYLDYGKRALSGGYEPEVTGLLDAIAGNASVVYDIGANWGYFVTVLMTNPAFCGHVHAFEIAPRSQRDLLKMVSGIGVDERVTCHRFGLSDANGTARIREGLHTFLTSVTDDERDGHEVPVSRLDDLDLPDPDIIKIDVEGHETAVLRGATQCLKRARPLIVFESWYSAQDLTGTLRPMTFLETLGYHFYQLSIDQGRLRLLPLPIGERQEIVESINIVAIHNDRADILRPGK